MHYETNALNGAELLTSKKPGWFREVDASQLDMRDVRLCVLGQLYGDYWDGLRVLFGDDCPYSEITDSYGFNDTTWGSELQDEWIEIITDLQAGDSERRGGR